MVDREEIKQALVYGKQAEIAKRAGVNESSVSSWFKGQINSERIEDAAIEVYAECVAIRKARQEKLESAKRGEKL